MRNFRWSLPIRVKIVLLIAGALAVSLVSFQFVGSTLISEDKVSYIYDYNLARVTTASLGVENRFEKALRAGEILSQQKTGSFSEEFTRHATPLGITGIAFLRPTANNELLEERHSGASPVSAEDLKQLNWTPKSFEHKQYLVAFQQNKPGTLALAGQTFDSENHALAFVISLSITPELLGTAKDSFIQLNDASGFSDITSSQLSEKIDEQDVRDLEQTLLKSAFRSGVRAFRSSGSEFIASYHKLASDQLIVVGLVSKSVAFSAAKELSKRSAVLGFGILLIAIGFTLVFIRSLTRRLEQMSKATQKVSQGDFSVRVDVKNISNDEVGALSISFNAMADKIDELMAQTAEKARMEKELETAQAVQARLFPTSGLTHEKLSLSGSVLSSSECGGDYWFFLRFEDHVLVVVGDVTGHGVSAALVTAAVHGSFVTVGRDIEARYKSGPSGSMDSHEVLKRLMSHLNTAVCAAGGGDSLMTFAASMLDLSSGTISLANASHHAPYVYRKGRNEAKDINPIKRFKPLKGITGPSLGISTTFAIETTSFQLEPGDTLIWYTDGLVECPNDEGEMYGRSRMLKCVSEAFDALKGDAAAVPAAIISQSVGFMGKMVVRPDDITVVVGKIPETALFSRKIGAA